MIYFDNAATSMPKPDKVKNAILEALDNCGNPARGSHKASLNGLRTLLNAREQIADYFNVSNSSMVVFTQNATAALNIAISKVKGHIVTTASEHNSVLRPIYRHGSYTIVPVDSLGRLDMNRLEAEIRPDTEAVVMMHASNLTGNIFDISMAGEICRRKGVSLIVDAAQTAGLIEIDMQKIGISALCFSGHKSLFGPQGTGALCLSPEYQPMPFIVGGSGSNSFSQEHPKIMLDRLEAGTQNAHGIAGLSAGIEYVKEKEGACFYEANELSQRFLSGIKELGYFLYGDFNAPLRTPVVAINHPTLDSAELADTLSNRYGIAVRAGAHCAPLMNKALGTENRGTVRFSFSHFNTIQEVDLALQALNDIGG